MGRAPASAQRTTTRAEGEVAPPHRRALPAQRASGRSLPRPLHPLPRGRGPVRPARPPRTHRTHTGRHRQARGAEGVPAPAAAPSGKAGSDPGCARGDPPRPVVLETVSRSIRIGQIGRQVPAPSGGNKGRGHSAERERDALSVPCTVHVPRDSETAVTRLAAGVPVTCDPDESA
jgi:hypothetical protein